MFHRLLTVNTPLGRKARPAVLAKGGPLIRVKRADLRAAGVQRVARVTGVRDGRPLLADGRTLEVANVIWCSGFEAGFDWIELPIFDAGGAPRHTSGVAERTAGPVLRRPALPVRDVVLDDPRRGPGCGAHRPRDPAQPRLPAQGCGAGGSGFLNRSTT